MKHFCQTTGYSLQVQGHIIKQNEKRESYLCFIMIKEEQGQFWDSPL